MGPGQYVRKIQVLVVILIGCSLMAGTVSAGEFSQLFPCATGSCSYPGCGQNPSVCVFGGNCSGRMTTITLGMTGARFSGTPTSGPAPLPVQFSANSGPEIATWSWDFGDGSYGSGMNPVHTYTTPGTYTVKLTVRQGQTSGSYQTSSCLSWGSENTWQKEAMIQVTGSVGTGILVSSEPKGTPAPETGLVQPGTTDYSGLAIQYPPGLYQPVTPRKTQALSFQRGVIPQRAPALTSWRAGNPGNGR